MAKLSTYPEITQLTTEDLFVVVNDPDGAPSTNVIQAKNVRNQFFDVKQYGALGDGVITGGEVSGTNDTAAIQSAINAAAAVRGAVFFPPGIYIHNSPLSLEGLHGVTLIGASGAIPWLFSPDIDRMGSLLVYKGTGTPPGWNCDSAIGIHARDLEFSYDSPSFTGPFFRLNKSGQEPASTFNFERCRFSSWTNDLVSAKCLVSLQFAISISFRRCAFYGAQWLIRGFETTNGLGEAPNSITIDDCLLQGAEIGFIANIGDWWTIKDSTLEAFPIPGIGVPQYLLGGDVTGIVSTFSYHNNQHWDCNDTGCIIMKQPAGNTWIATFRENFFDGSFFDTVHFDLQGPGAITIEGNRFLQVLNGTTMPTLINLGDPSTAKKTRVRIAGNSWTTGSNNCPDLVSNILGHENVEIVNNDPNGWGREITTVSGHERLGYVGGAAQFQPTIAAHSGQTLGTLDLHGTDVAGYFLVQAGGSNSIPGLLVDITFAKAFISHPETVNDNNHKIPSVLLTPLETDSGGGAASVNCGAYVRTFFGDRTKFSVGTTNAVPAGTVIQFAYRVIQV